MNAYEDHYVRLVRLARQLTDDIESAEEVVQEVFIRIRRRGEPVEPTLAYLRTAVVNQSRSLLRRRLLARRESIAQATENSHPEDTANRVVERELIRSAIERLPRRQKEVIVLRYYEDL